MAELNSWRVLTESDREEVVLAVDYAATGRPEAAFTDLAAHLDGGYEIWETVQPPLGGETGMTGADYVARWADEVRGTGRPVRAVFGFCAGGVFAGALADRVAAWQPSAPRLVLFDPEAPTEATLYYQFHKVVDSLSTLLDPEQAAAAQQAGQHAWQSGQGVAEVGAELVGIFERVGRDAFARAGLDAEYGEEWVATYRSFVSYLVAASHLGRTPAWATATAVSSATPTSGLNAVDPAARAGAVAEEVRFAVTHADLLGHPEVARTVAGLLG
ncbi:hypothetical protein [Goodfellowiella coeruleoviolacea]|uniref:Thioesterase domain-containing protein n=1 Tax=Goodfellowiella coeruleoviolacea TaxID=334858 RepID=A0AAE3GLG8_9PSEU|nr:hypothetical protein [Goodfellowiella coeruleoviolacea]MCP2170200.1 hypothetical protein [Goodfellowiella coeruleoviolacea]